jgi:hypothetical protein
LLTCTCMLSNLPKAMATILDVILYVSWPKTKWMIPSSHILVAITNIDALVSTNPSITLFLISMGKCMFFFSISFVHRNLSNNKGIVDNCNLILASDVLPSSLIDSNVNLKRNQRKSKKLGHAPWFTALWG